MDCGIILWKREKSSYSSVRYSIQYCYMKFLKTLCSETSQKLVGPAQWTVLVNSKCEVDCIQSTECTCLMNIITSNVH